MKAVKKLATILKVTGVVLLCVCIALSIYSLANTGKSWNETKQALNASGVQTNIVDRVKLDSTYFSALSDAASNKKQAESLRVAALVPHYQDYIDRAVKSENDARLQTEADVLNYFANEFDYAAFESSYEQKEEKKNARLITEACASLDGMVVNTLPNGKKLPMKAGSDAATVTAAAYEALFAEHGEEAGEYVEYVETMEAIAKAAVDGGEQIKDLPGFIAAVSYEDYLAALENLRASERAASDSLLDDFEELAEKMAAGEVGDVSAFMQTAFEKLSAKYPDAQLSTSSLAVAVKNLLNDAAFDGSYAAVKKAVDAVEVQQKDASFEGYVSKTLCPNVVKEADARSTIGVVGLFWKVVSLTAVWWIVSIVLLILSGVITKVMTSVMIKQLKNAGIQEDPDVLLRVEHLKQYFRSGDYVNKAVDDVSFYIKKGEVFGLVGESGCGKTTTGRTIINLYDPTDGDVYFGGLRISSTKNGLPVYKRQKRNELNAAIEAKKAEMKEACAKEPNRASELKAKCNEEIKAMKAELRRDFVQAETHALESSIEKSKCVEMYRERRKAELKAEYEEDIKTLTGTALEDRKQRYETELKLASKDNIMTRMQMIFQDPIASINPRMTVREIIAGGLIIRGVKDKKYIDNKVNEMLELVGLVPEHADRYPHEFSGGQRQRIGIARAIVMQPDLIIADEPISALDVSIQAQVINLMNDLRNRMGLTIMFIAHNLSVVKYFSDRIGVMYFGHLVELATSDELFAHPLHPYTKSLLSAIPYPDPHHERNRKRIEYNPNKEHDYTVDKPTLHEITPGHFIRCNEAELEKYKKELGV